MGHLPGGRRREHSAAADAESGAAGAGGAAAVDAEAGPPAAAASAPVPAAGLDGEVGSGGSAGAIGGTLSTTPHNFPGMHAVRRSAESAAAVRPHQSLLMVIACSSRPRDPSRPTYAHTCWRACGVLVWFYHLRCVHVSG